MEEDDLFNNPILSELAESMDNGGRGGFVSTFSLAPLAVNGGVDSFGSGGAGELPRCCIVAAALVFVHHPYCCITVVDGSFLICKNMASRNTWQRRQHTSQRSRSVSHTSITTPLATIHTDQRAKWHLSSSITSFERAIASIRFAITSEHS
jgi:hypothetical protein